MLVSNGASKKLVAEAAGKGGVTFTLDLIQSARNVIISAPKAAQKDMVALALNNPTASSNTKCPAGLCMRARMYMCMCVHAQTWVFGCVLVFGWDTRLATASLTVAVSSTHTHTHTHTHTGMISASAETRVEWLLSQESASLLA